MIEDDRRYPETARLREHLRLLFRVYGKTFPEIEAVAGLPSGTFSKAFADLRELRIEHVLTFCKVVGLTPSEFFDWAYPPTAAEPSAAALRLFEVQELLSKEVSRRKMPIRLPCVILERHWKRLSSSCREELIRVLVEGEGLR